jgi:hypothetical protein
VTVALGKASPVPLPDQEVGRARPLGELVALVRAKAPGGDCTGNDSLS